MTMLAQFAAAGGGALPAYIEDIFSTFLYTGTGAGVELDINNGIDLATEGGMLWCKSRSNEQQHWIFDTNRNMSYAAASILNSASADAQTGGGTNFIKPTTTGFTLGTGAGSTSPKTSGYTYASWTFRKQPKFFDVVTYTGNGSDPRNIAHNLGSVPGSMIIKCTSTGATDWFVYHRSLGNSQSLNLNQTAAAETGTAIWGTTTPTSTVFTVGNINANTNGRTYVAYLFAHDAGGFGLSGTENVISCGSYTVSTLAEITLGYEPQFLLVRKSNGAGSNWFLLDSMRDFSLTNSAYLRPNSSGAEISSGSPGFFSPTATGFIDNNQVFTNGDNVIYIAIRRGPMKVPELGTTVFTPVTATPGGSAATVVTGITTDLVITAERSHALSGQTYVVDRLRGSSSATARSLNTASTAAEAPGAGGITFSSPVNTSVNDNLYPASGITNPVVYWFFQRAPRFFDEVCYTGTGANRTVTHNLAAVPELMIVKNRVQVGGERWTVYTTATTATKAMYLDGTNAATTASVFWNNTEPTASVFSVGTAGNTNTNAETYVAYLFATCPGVSKVGSYTGTAATQVINCGFTTGARFVLIKRTDSTGDWYVWDSARGIVAGNDPYLLWNNGAPEVTSTDYVDASATGFELTSTAPAAINASGGSYIFLAVA